MDEKDVRGRFSGLGVYRLGRLDAPLAGRPWETGLGWICVLRASLGQQQILCTNALQHFGSWLRACFECPRYIFRGGNSREGDETREFLSW